MKDKITVIIGRNHIGGVHTYVFRNGVLLDGVHSCHSGENHGHKLLTVEYFGGGSEVFVTDDIETINLTEQHVIDTRELTVTGHPKEEFDTLLRRVGARVPLDDGMYDLSLAFNVTKTGYMVTNANLQRVPEPPTQAWPPVGSVPIMERIREASRRFNEANGTWPNTVCLGTAEYNELRSTVPHGTKIIFPATVRPAGEVALTIQRVRTPRHLAVFRIEQV